MTSEMLKTINVLILDVDGVLTDGGIIYDDTGAETKVFNVKDGLGIRLLMESGVRIFIVTGRRSEALRHRCRNLGLTDVYDGVGDKKSVLHTILEKTGATPDQVAAMGDDLPDLPLMKRVGVAIAVADAADPVRQMAHMVTNRGGGKGAVREVCEAILKAQKRWDPILKGFTA